MGEEINKEHEQREKSTRYILARVEVFIVVKNANRDHP